MSEYRDALLRDHPEQVPLDDVAVAEAGRLLAEAFEDIRARAQAGDADMAARYARLLASSREARSGLPAGLTAASRRRGRRRTGP